MGILNVTPDSFSDGGEHYDVASQDGHSDADNIGAICDYARMMIHDGANIIDIGGESTRPGSDEVPINEELARVMPVVEALAKDADAAGVAISIDTRHPSVAAACVRAGASVINDITGFTQADRVDVAKGCEAGCVIMHMRGNPKTMQAEPPYYDDVVRDVSDWLCAQARLLEGEGVSRERICIDPGPGFGKAREHNLAILRATDKMSRLGYAYMAAWSRKRFIGELTGIAAPADRDVASAILAAYAVALGAHIVRVHNVAMTAQALKVASILVRE
jgi:dihydropteroate synthase